MRGSFSKSGDQARNNNYKSYREVFMKKQQLIRAAAMNAAGVNTSSDKSGYKILNNIFKNNTFGLSLNNQGSSQAKVEDNFFQNNNNGGSAAGNGIYSDQKLVNVLIERNKFSGNQKRLYNPGDRSCQPSSPF